MPNEYDLDKFIPISGENRSTNFEDVDLNDFRPITVMDKIKETSKEVGKSLLSEIGREAKIIRWPFWRFIEQPVSTMVTAAQEPKGKTVGGTLGKAFQGYVPFREIPVEEYGNYGQIWRNYYKSITKQEPPTWYIAMASYGTAMGVEPPIIRGVEKGAELAATRVATAKEAEIIRNAFVPLRTKLEQGGLDSAKLHAEGNIIKLSENSELYLNKYVSAVLRGDKIRIPRWAKIDEVPLPATVEKVSQALTISGKTDILPLTGKEVVLPAPPVQAQPQAGEINPLLQEAKKYKTAEEFVKAQGKPLYHGTSANFEKFNIAKVGTLKPSDWGRVGIYFDPSKSGADYYREEAVKATDEEGKKLWQDYVNKAKELGTKPMYETIDLGFGSPKYNELKKVYDKYAKHREELGKDKAKGRVIEAYISPDAKVYKHIYEPGMITDQYLSDRMLGQGYDVVEIWDRDPDTKEKWLSEVIVMNPKVIKTKSQLTSIWQQANQSTPTEGKGIEPNQEVLTEKDIPPEEPKFPGVSKNFLKQPKPKTTIIQYFTPAEYHLKQLGFDAEIGKPVRQALQNFSMELMQKNELIQSVQKEHYAQIKKKDIKLSNEKVFQYLDKGIPDNDTSIEAQIARKLRPETEEMLSRMNELNKRIGKEEIKGVKNYILHMLKPEILNEIYSTGVIPPELAKVMQYIPAKNVFLRTAQQRKGVPEEWLVKNPYELMKAMYAIDLRYIYLQDALDKIDPYLKAVKDYVGSEGDYWSPEVYHYLDDWVKQAIKMRPSNWDILIDNMLEYTFAPLFRKVGIKVSHMPWRDLINTLSASVHVGALGMRIKPILRNLVQSTFDWVYYGTKPYLKGSAKFMTKEGMEILRQSKIWKTRMPFEAQDISTLRKMFKVGSIGYRISDLHNVGKGLLTRYYHAIDDLGMSHEEAIKWADDDLPATQWSYRREDLPRAYWTTTGRAFWTLGSWWMNFYTRFLPELAQRAFTGSDVNGRKVPTSERIGIIRFIILIGMLYELKDKSKELFGTVIDYTGSIKPSILREAPIAQVLLSIRDIAQGLVDEDEKKLREGMQNLSNTSKIFIPWYLAGEDLWSLITGKKDINDVMFYNKKKKNKVMQYRR